MGTRSTIAILKTNGTVQSIYAHWDGYPTGNGAILYEHYTDPKKVKELVKNGGVSSLKAEINPPPGVEHNEDKRAPNVTTFYLRDFKDNIDRTEKAKKYDSLDEYFQRGDMQEYNYIFLEKEKKWYLINTDFNKLNDLEDIITIDPRFSDSDISKYIKMKKLKEELDSRNNEDEDKNHIKKMKI